MAFFFSYCQIPIVVLIHRSPCLSLTIPHSCIPYKASAVGEWNQLVLLPVKFIETFFCADDNLAIVTFADGIGLMVLQEMVPSEVLETPGLGVEARYTIGGSYPEMVGMVECHASYPVVAEVTLVASLLHIEYPDGSTFHIIYI